MNTWGQACQLGDNRKNNNKNYDNPYTEIKLIGQEGAKFFATNLATKSSPFCTFLSNSF
jgi:hypothetical protein